MRLRSNLCTEPFATGPKAQSIEPGVHNYIPAIWKGKRLRRLLGDLLDALKGRSPYDPKRLPRGGDGYTMEYVRLARFGALEPETGHRGNQDRRSRDNGRRAVRVQADDVATFGQRDRREVFKHALARVEMQRVAVDSRRVVGL